MSQENPHVEGEEIFGFKLEEGQHVNVVATDGEETFRLGGENTPGRYSLVKSDTDGLRQQVEFSKEFLEWSHGMALRNKNPDKAEAFNTAVGLIDDSLEERWDPEKIEDPWDEWDQEFIDESREAREDGVRAATLHEERRRQRRRRYGTRSPLSQLWDNLTPVMMYRGIRDWLSRKTNNSEGDTNV